MNDLSVHPMGAAKKPPESDCRALVPAEGPVVLDTFGGRVHVEWDPSAAVTPLGQLAFFTEYLKVGDLFEPWVEQCPVRWTSNNAPKQARRAGHGGVVDLVRPPALRPHQRRARRQHQRRTAGDGEGRQRRLRASHAAQARRDRRGCLVAAPSVGRERAAARRSLGFSIPMSPSSRSSVTRKGRCSVTTRTNRDDRRTPTIPTSSPLSGWCWRSR